jgi:hypothetical protein
MYFHVDHKSRARKINRLCFFQKQNNQKSMGIKQWISEAGLICVSSHHLQCTSVFNGQFETLRRAY